MENSKTVYNRVTAIFDSNQDADAAYDSLLKRGYSQQDISVVMSDTTQQSKFQINADQRIEKTHAVDDAGRGALLGGATGGIVTAIAAISTNIALPGLGLVFVGPLLAGLAGAAAGSIAGGTIGAIVGSGYPKEQAEYYETSIKGGGILISVNPSNTTESKLIIEDFKRHNGQRIFADDEDMDRSYLIDQGYFYKYH